MNERVTQASIDLASARFVTSAHLPRQWPEPAGAEVAFAGRSNVGKSSAVNAIARRKGLAKTSKTPGRTQQIVFFELDSGHRLVDLPGYGFARVPVAMRRHWEQTINAYLSTREPLRALILPVDSRRLLTDLDEQMLDWCAAVQLPVHILLTKADKLSRNQAGQALLSVRKAIATRAETTVQLFSAHDRRGVDEARDVVVSFLTTE